MGKRKKICSGFGRAVLLCAGLGFVLAGCAAGRVPDDAAKATEKPVSIEIVPQYDNDANKAETPNRTIKLPTCVQETKLIEALVLVNGVMNRDKQIPCYKSLTPPQMSAVSMAVKKIRVVNVLRKKQHDIPVHICFSRPLSQQKNIWSIIDYSDNTGRCADSNKYVLTESMFWRAINTMEQAGIITDWRRKNDRKISVEILKPEFGSPELFTLNGKEILRLSFPLLKVGKLDEESLSTSRLPYGDRYCTNPNTFYARQLKPVGKVGRLFLGTLKRGKAVGYFSACVTQWEWEATIHYPRLINLNPRLTNLQTGD